MQKKPTAISNSQKPHAQSKFNLKEFFLSYKYILAIIIGYFVIRLINLTLIPIFNDESIYIDWGWRAFHLGVPFYSLSDGKQPFLMWVFGISEGIIKNPLIAGRIISVISGFFSLLGLYLIGRDVFSEKVGRIAALFYIFVPIFSFFDRQALMESSVIATQIWTVYLFIRILKKPSLLSASILGIVTGVGFFIKSTILLLILPITISYTAIFRFRQENKSFWRDVVIAIVISQVVLLPLYAQDLFWSSLSMNERYSMGFSELLKFPLNIWISNILALLQISFWHLTPLVFVASIAGVVLIFKNKDKFQRLIAVTFILQIFFLLLLAKNINPRYAVSALPLSLIFVASFIMYFKKYSTILIILILAMPIYFTFLQVFMPFSYFDQLQTLTKYSQKQDYVTDFTAGYAVTQAVNYLKNTNDPSAIVAVRFDAGNPENGVFTFFHGSSKLPIYLEPEIINNISAYNCITFNIPIYFVSRDTQLAGFEPYMQEEKRFYNPGDTSSVGVYHFKSNCSKEKTLDLNSPGAIRQPPQ